MNRRLFLQLGLWLSLPAQALTGMPDNTGRVMLDVAQSSLFRQWLTAIIRQQIRQGPSKRWQHRDCAGLVRFAVSETLRQHDVAWRRASGLSVGYLPPEIQLTPPQMALRNQWHVEGGQTSAYVGALGMIQHNSIFVGKNSRRVSAGDLLFFDQGDHQHLMVWLGNNVIAYHTGTVTQTDNGLRAVNIADLINWKDTRWRIEQNNPNFIGFYRFAFLSR